MELIKHVKTILNNSSFENNCRGLNNNTESANAIVEYYFKKENISFEGWKISEIPVIDNSGKYEIAIVICIVNYELKKGITLNITSNGELDSTNPDELEEIEYATIKESIEDDSSNFEVEEEEKEELEKTKIKVNYYTCLSGDYKDSEKTFTIFVNQEGNEKKRIINLVKEIIEFKKKNEIYIAKICQLEIFLNDVYSEYYFSDVDFKLFETINNTYFDLLYS